MKTVICDNLSRAAWLVSNGIKPIRHERVGSRSRWTFEASEHFERLDTDFYQGIGTAGAIKRFMAARARLLDDAHGTSRFEEEADIQS